MTSTMLISDNETTLSLLQMRAHHSPNSLYARYEQKTLTVAELCFQANKTAAALSSLGVQRGERVAVMLVSGPFLRCGRPERNR
jgi:acyl-CoA synthetase (AMP-forming)/AMP-acid ligase II